MGRIWLGHGNIWALDLTSCCGFAAWLMTYLKTTALKDKTASGKSSIRRDDMITDFSQSRGITKAAAKKWLDEGLRLKVLTIDKGRFSVGPVLSRVIHRLETFREDEFNEALNKSPRPFGFGDSPIRDTSFVIDKVLFAEVFRQFGMIGPEDDLQECEAWESSMPDNVDWYFCVLQDEMFSMNVTTLRMDEVQPGSLLAVLPHGVVSTQALNSVIINPSTKYGELFAACGCFPQYLFHAYFD